MRSQRLSSTLRTADPLVNTLSPPARPFFTFQSSCRVREPHLSALGPSPPQNAISVPASLMSTSPWSVNRWATGHPHWSGRGRTAGSQDEASNFPLTGPEAGVPRQPQWQKDMTYKEILVQSQLINASCLLVGSFHS